MPQAFSVAYGLDLETELSSFWAWLHDAQAILAGAAEGSKQARDVIESQRPHLEKLASAQLDPEQARFGLSLAVAMVGFHYASTQKLLNGLRDFGLLETPGRPAIFDTIVEPALEDSEPR